MPGKKLIFIDGNSLLYRSYYAIRNLTNSRGFPTNAIFGFLSTLRKILKEENPHYLGIVFDSRGPTARHELFEDYKAHRKPMPEDLVPQIPKLKQILQAMNIPLYQKTGYEGDDLLGTLSRKAAEHNIHSVILTNDKDLYQLADQNISVYHVAKDKHLNEADIKEEFGVEPRQVKDVLALWGDPSDNIPGIQGIGEKTAKKLIQTFGSLDALLENLDAVKNIRVKKNIRQQKDRLALSRKLAEISRDLPLDFHLKDFEITDPDYDKLLPLLQELDFTSLLSQYLQEKGNGQKTKCRLILEEKELDRLITKIKQAGRVSVDTETDSLFPTRARLIGMSFAVKPHSAWYLPLRHDYLGAPRQIPVETALSRLKPVLADPEIKKIGQNIKYDVIVTRRENIPLNGIELDSMVLSYLADPNRGKHNLDSLAVELLNVTPTSFAEITGKGKNARTMNAVDIEEAGPYACEDADLALQLSERLWPRIQKKNLASLYHDIEKPLIGVLADMEIWGIKIDPDSMNRLSRELEQDMKTLEGKIYDLAQEEFNINSPRQLSRILFEKLKLPPSKKTKKTGGYSTGFSVLNELAGSSSIARFTLEYRRLAKLKSSYADTLPVLINPETGRIHTSYNQTVAATGRLSSSDPNLQNIPTRGEWGRRFRSAFIPEKGNLFLCADYSQIELRILAHLSGDPRLMETFQQDRDIHRETALHVFGDESLLSPEEIRRRAKIINFSIIYGTSAFSLAKELETSPGEAQNFISRYFEKHPAVRNYLDLCVESAREKGYSETLMGRRREIPELKQSNKMVQEAGRRIALNTPIQGAAADLIKMAMIQIWKDIQSRGFSTRMVLQVHDELVFEVPDNEKELMESLVRERMENVFALNVPLKVHLGWGINWWEAK
ncbi:MAG: DNA polymerase I [Candidatus Aminicenantes bacterium]